MDHESISGSTTARKRVTSMNPFENGNPFETISSNSSTSSNFDKSSASLSTQLTDPMVTQQYQQQVEEKTQFFVPKSSSSDTQSSVLPEFVVKKSFGNNKSNIPSIPMKKIKIKKRLSPILEDEEENDGICGQWTGTFQKYAAYFTCCSACSCILIMCCIVCVLLLVGVLVFFRIKHAQRNNKLVADVFDQNITPFDDNAQRLQQQPNIPPPVLDSPPEQQAEQLQPVEPETEKEEEQAIEEEIVQKVEKKGTKQGPTLVEHVDEKGFTEIDEFETQIGKVSQDRNNDALKFLESRGKDTTNFNFEKEIDKNFKKTPKIEQKTEKKKLEIEQKPQEPPKPQEKPKIEEKQPPEDENDVFNRNLEEEEKELLKKPEDEEETSNDEERIQASKNYRDTLQVRKNFESATSNNGFVTLSARQHLTQDAQQSVRITDGNSAFLNSHRCNNGKCPKKTLLIPVVVFTYNRPQYLKRAVEILNKNLKHYQQVSAKNPQFYDFSFFIVISQDGNDAETTKLIRNDLIPASEKMFASKTQKNSKKPIEWIVHPRETVVFPPRVPGEQNRAYYHISQHYFWAIDTLFLNTDEYPFAIMLEDDIEISPDFFFYFHAMAKIMYKNKALGFDENLLLKGPQAQPLEKKVWAVSAWNDNGMKSLVSDPQQFYRSDFFPGLGWMLSRDLWKTELRWLWPLGFWDDWMRETEVRRKRVTIRPEISRTYTFGQLGVSQGQFFAQYLSKIELFTSKVPQYYEKNIAQLEEMVLNKENKFDADLRKRLENAVGISIQTVNSLISAKENANKEFKVFYHDLNSFGEVARHFGLMAETKSGVPRGGYLGIIPFKYQGKNIFLVPAAPNVLYDHS